MADPKPERPKLISIDGASLTRADAARALRVPVWARIQGFLAKGLEVGDLPRRDAKSLALACIADCQFAKEEKEALRQTRELRDVVDANVRTIALLRDGGFLDEADGEDSGGWGELQTALDELRGDVEAQMARERVVTSE